MREVIIDSALPSWWSGDARVEPYMMPIREALKKEGITGQARINISNRAYEAIHKVITDKKGDEK